jgi:hypothetical protein
LGLHFKAAEFSGAAGFIEMTAHIHGPQPDQISFVITAMKNHKFISLRNIL